MRRVLRGVGRWSLRALLALLALVGLYVLLLTWPTPLFAHEARFGEYRVYSDAPIPDDFGRVIEEARRRISAMEHAPQGKAPRIYLCEARGRYALFAFLTRKDPGTLAIGISAANEMFVSAGRVREFAAANRGRIHHSRFEGNLSEVIAHEIAHFNSIRALGYRPHLAQPVWKSEGWAEYQANLAAIREDPGYDLGKRIDLLLDDGFWGRQTLARSLWEWQILVEYLGEIEGLGLADLVREDVSRSSAMDRMLGWYRSRAGAGG